MTEARVFVLAGVRPPAQLDPMPQSEHAKWTYSGPDCVIRPISVGDVGFRASRMAIEYPAPVSHARAARTADAMAALFSLYTLDGPQLSVGAVLNGMERRGVVQIDPLTRQMANDYDVEEEETFFFELFESSRVLGVRLRWMCSVFTRPMPKRLSESLIVNDSSVRERVRHFGAEPDSILATREQSSSFSPEAISEMVLGAYRAIETLFGGPLSSNRAKLDRRLAASGFDPRWTWGPSGTLGAETHYVQQNIRGAAAHGGTRTLSLAEMIRAQRLARFFLRRAIRSCSR